MKYSFYLSNTGAAVTLALGFKPHRVRVTNIVSGETLEWHRGMLNNAATLEGVKTVAAGTRSLLGAGAGISLFTGGARVATSAAAVQTPVFTQPLTLMANQRANGVSKLGAAPVGQTLPDGIVISETADVNAVSEFSIVEVERDDDIV
jgi:hypothetical protein